MPGLQCKSLLHEEAGLDHPSSLPHIVSSFTPIQARTTEQKTPQLIPVQRRGLLLDFLRQRGAASVNDLAAAIGASLATVRRDLEQLEGEGYLSRTRGGALVQETTATTFEPDSDIAAEVARAEKAAIARAAAATLAAGESVIFDSGSTVHMAALAAIEAGLALTAVTNDLRIGLSLSKAAQMHLIVLGGMVRRGSPTMVGDPARGLLADLRADVAFIGTHAISEGVLSDTSMEIASMKRSMIAAARRVVLLADSTKFRTAAFFKICDLSMVHEVYTDSGVRAEHLAFLRERGVRTTVVEVAPPRAA